MVVNCEPGDQEKDVFSVNDIGSLEELTRVLPTSLRVTSPRAPEGTFSHCFQNAPEELVVGNEPMTVWPRGEGYSGFQVTG